MWASSRHEEWLKSQNAAALLSHLFRPQLAAIPSAPEDNFQVVFLLLLPLYCEDCDS